MDIDGWRTALKIAFYFVSGVLLASIAWSTISHSIVTGDYLLSVILLGMMFFVVGKFFVDRWQPEHGPQDFHPQKPWKLPRETTLTGLWLRVGFSTLTGISIYSLLASLLVMTTTAQLPFMVLLGSLFFLRIPHLYWSLRGRYDVCFREDATDNNVSRLVYRGGSTIGRKAFWMVPLGMAVAGTVLAGLGTLLLKIT